MSEFGSSDLDAIEAEFGDAKVVCGNGYLEGDWDSSAGSKKTNEELSRGQIDNSLVTGMIVTIFVSKCTIIFNAQRYLLNINFLFFNGVLSIKREAKELKGSHLVLNST